LDNAGNKSEMAKLKFKNPFILKETKMTKASTTKCNYTSNPEVNCLQSQSMDVYLPDNQISGATPYSVRFHIWNQTVGTTIFTRRGYAGTQAQANIGGSWYGFGHANVPSGLSARVRLYAQVRAGASSGYWNQSECSASISAQYPNNNFPYAIPYDYFVTKSCNDVITDKKREANFHAKSIHSAWVVDYFTTSVLWPYMNYNRVEHNPQIVNSLENRSGVGNHETGEFVNLVNYGLE